MRTETLSLTISGDGKQLGTELGRSEGKVKGFAGKVGGMFAGVGKKITGAFGKLANPLALIGGTAGVMMAARDLMQYQDSISTLGISAGLGAEDMMKLEKSIQSTAYTTGQSREALVGAVKELADITGDTNFAAAAMESVGRASTAMSMDVMSTAQAFGAFRRDMGASVEEAEVLFNTMAAMDTHTMSMDRFARSVQTLGLTKENFADYNALIKTIAPTFGGVEGAANAIDGIISNINSDRRIKQKIGADMFDADGAVKDYRAFAQRVAGLGAGTINKMFGKNFSKAFLPFQDASGFEAFDEVIRSGERATHVTDAFARKQGEAKFQLSTLTTAGKEFAGIALSPVLAQLTAHLNALTSNPEAMAEFRNNLAGVAEMLGHVGQAVGWVGKGLKAWGDFWGDMGAAGVNDQYFGEMGGKLKGELRKKHQAKGLKGRALDEAMIDDYMINFKTAPEPMREQRLQTLIADNKSKGQGGGQAQAAAAPEIKNNNTINLTVGINGDRVITQSDDPASRLNTNVDRGAFR